MDMQGSGCPRSLDGHTLDLDTVTLVARHPGRLELRLDFAASARMDESTHLRRRLVNDGAAVYGVTTGFGDSANSQVSPDLAAELQNSLIRYHLNGAGPDTPREVVRAMTLIRANCLARGVSGVRGEVVRSLLALLAADIVPVIPERGSVGASGDLVPSCYLATVLTGEGEVWHQGRREAASDALRSAGLTPLRLEPKEGLALINGTSFMTAYAALAARDATEIAYVADLCTAMASQVLLGYPGHFADFLTRHKPHTGTVDSASTIAKLLAESAMSTRPSGQEPLGPSSIRQLSRHIQDRYSVRCAPHITGVLRDTLQWADRWITTEINSANDNPLFDVEEGIAHSGGNFYGGHIAQAMDSLKVAVANVADLLDRQLALIVDGKFSNGLPSNLVPPFSENAAPATLHHGYKGMQIAASAFAAESLKVASPASVFSRSTEGHNQDKVSMGAIAARDARNVVELTEHVAAVHLHALCQAADLRGADLLSPATRRAYDIIRQEVTFVATDRRLDTDLDTIVRLIRNGTLRQACEAAVNPPSHDPVPRTFSDSAADDPPLSDPDQGTTLGTTVHARTAPVPRPRSSIVGGDRYDAVVIGGGPAGAIAAHTLATRGHSVLVLERSDFPRFHIGESLMPYSRALLGKLGFDDALREIALPKHGAEFTETDGTHRRVDFTAQGGGRVSDTYQVERANFDLVLLRAAADAGAAVRHGTKVSRVLTDGAGRITGVTYRTAAGECRVYGSRVLDASGRAGVIANQHLRTRVGNERLRMVALFRHFDGVDEANNPGFTGDIQVGSHADGWVWAIPLRGDRLSIGTVMPPDVLAGADRSATFYNHVARIPRIAQRLTGAVAVGGLRGESDFTYHSETVAGPGFLVLGDAGCFADPIFSGGVHLGLVSGWKAAELTADCLDGRLDETAAAAEYERFYKTGYDCYLRLIYAFYDAGFKLGPYLKSTGARVEPRWLARLLCGDFWSRKNPLPQHLRTIERYATFAPFEPLYGCPVYPNQDAAEPDGQPLGPRDGAVLTDGHQA